MPPPEPAPAAPPRAVALARSGLLDSPPEPEFDRLTSLAVRLARAPISVLSVIDADRQFFKSAVGLPDEVAGLRETPLSHSLCRHVVAADAPLAVADTRDHPVVRGNGAIESLGAIAYLGVPVRDPDGVPLGALCAIDTEPRAWTDGDLGALTELAELAMAELARRRDARRFRTLVAAGGAVTFTADGAGAVSELSETWAAFTGQSAGEIEGWGWADAVHPDDRDRVVAGWRARAARRAPYVAEFRVVGADGGARRFSVHAVPALDDAGRFVEYVGTAVDVEDARTAEEALAERDRLLRSFYDAAPLSMGVAEVLDDDVVHRLDNGAAARFFGTTVEALRDRRGADLAPTPETHALWLGRYREAARTGRPVSFEYERAGPDGVRTLAATVTRVGTSAAGRPVCSYVIDDVTEERARVRALHESEARRRLALDAARAGSWSYDLRADRAEWSPRACQLYGAGALGGRLADAMSLVHADDLDRVEREAAAAVATAAATGRPARFRVEHRLAAPELRWLRTLGRVYVEDGAPSRVAGVVLDVTDERARADALTEARDRALGAQAEAEAAARLQRSILHNMSHEVRTPLTAIVGFAEILGDTVTGPDAELVRAIQDGADRLLDALTSVLDLARLEAGVALALEPVDVAAEAEAVVGLLRGQAERAGLALAVEGPGGAVWAEADGGAVRRVLANLVGNAVKFTERGGVTVRVGAAPGGAVAVEVEDTGRGMSPAFLERAFEPFEQESDGFRRSHEGTGLGLSIVRQLVEAVGGAVAVESERGRGTRFRVTLRAAAPVGRPAPPATAEPGVT